MHPQAHWLKEKLLKSGFIREDFTVRTARFVTKKEKAESGGADYGDAVCFFRQYHCPLDKQIYLIPDMLANGLDVTTYRKEGKIILVNVTDSHKGKGYLKDIPLDEDKQAYTFEVRNDQGAELFEDRLETTEQEAKQHAEKMMSEIIEANGEGAMVVVFDTSKEEVTRVTKNAILFPHIGKEGEKIAIDVTLVDSAWKRNTAKSGFKYETYIYLFEDEKGSSLVWYTWKKQDLHRNVSYRLAARVKEHGWHESKPQTTVQHCKISEA